MSSSTATVTTTSAAATVTPACNANQLPISEAACAVPFGGNHTDVMSTCCKDASVVSYFNDCGLYCVAADQTIQELQECLSGEGVPYNNIFCNAANNATATNTDPDIPATASASVVANGGDDNNNNDNNDNDGDNNSNDPKPSESDSAAGRMAPEFGVSKTGLTIGALLFSAMAFGAFQI